MFFKFKKKKHRYEEESETYDDRFFIYDDNDETLDESFDEDSSIKDTENIGTAQFSKRDVLPYINSQCDSIADINQNIMILKEEYAAVTSYFSDIQAIEAAPEELADEIKAAAEMVDSLTVDRRIFKSTENKMPGHIYNSMERLEPLMPKALIDLQNDESYFDAVKKDMRMLEGERTALRYDAVDLTRRQINIKSISTFLFSIIGVVFVIFIAASFVMEDAVSAWFIVVVLLSAFMAVALFAVLKSTERKVLVTEIKINKASELLNKVKIKYINIASKRDYQYEKYGVKNSYELGRKYELYLEMKKEKQKIRELTSNLDETEIRLENLLRELHLYDPHIWLEQVKALIDSKEMVEVRHALNTRRRKLRDSIEFSQNKIEEAKSNIRRAAFNYPEMKNEVMNILSRYEDYEI